MTKNELLELLEDVDGNDEIYIAQPTGDYWRHIKVIPIHRGEFTLTMESAYTESLIEYESNDDDWEKENKETETVFVLA